MVEEVLILIQESRNTLLQVSHIKELQGRIQQHKNSIYSHISSNITATRAAKFFKKHQIYQLLLVQWFQTRGSGASRGKLWEEMRWSLTFVKESFARQMCYFFYFTTFVVNKNNINGFFFFASNLQRFLNVVRVMTVVFLSSVSF